jgi:hypothetical protein
MLAVFIMTPQLRYDGIMGHIIRYFGNARYIFLLFAAAAFILCACETVLWNDLAAQGIWYKASKVQLIDKMMIMEINNSHIRWKEKGADDGEENISCAASFGVIYLQFPEKTIKGSYFSFLNYLVLSGFTWDDRLDWLNGGWEK